MSETQVPTETISIVIPLYNEKDTVLELIRRVQATPFNKEIIIVDDGSADGSWDVVKDLDGQDGIRVFQHEKNSGKGAALQTGFDKATGDIILIQDADLEYTPEDYPALIRPILDGKADVVYGSRFLGGPHRCHLYWHYVVNRGLTTLSNIFTNINLTDMETCYKVFRADILKQIKLKSKRFGIEPEITAKIAKLRVRDGHGELHRRCRVYEVPISYFGRDYAEGKKIGWKDGFQAIWCILRYNLFR